MRAGLVVIGVLFSILPGIVIGSSEAADMIEISNHPQLFLDDHVVEKMENLKRELHRPQKHPEPVIVREHPWERRAISIYGTVLYEPELGKFRCWYLASGSPDRIPDTPEGPGLAEYYLCYAESKDGIAWTKPMVGSGKLGPYTKHNIVIPAGHGICVMKTPWDGDPSKRYKGAGGNIFAWSPDGIHWTTKSWPEVGKNDTGTSMVWWRGEYLAFVRYQGSWAGGVMREVGLSISKDFEKWTKKTPVFKTDAKDGYPWTQPYGLCVTAYGDQLIGLVPLLHLDKKKGNNSLGDMDVQLMVSRDGRNWHRVADRAVFIPQEPAGPVIDERPWDMRVYPGTTMFVKDNKVYIYYTGTNIRHGEGKTLQDKDKMKIAIGLATLSADRFVSLRQAKPGREGILQTRLLRFSGKDLLINAETGRKGLHVELVNEKGGVIPGFERDKSQLIRHDKLRYRVVWTNETGRKSLQDATSSQPLALRFFLSGGSLYAFQITGSGRR